MNAFLIAFGVIFVAELGDKSQLMALAFATRYKALPVLIGITGATALVHLASVAAGSLLKDHLPTRGVAVVAALAFFGFAWWTWRGDELDETDEERVRKSSGHNAIVAASIAFFLAELGDKTMLATITLATDHGPVGTWAGSTVGMVAADAIAIAVGKQLGSRLPERTIRIGATIAFVVFGVLLLVDALAG